MLMKRFAFVASALFAFFCSGFVSESYLNKAIANAQSSDVQTAAKEKVKITYPEFIQIVKDGAGESEITAFAMKNMDTEAISKSFCGANSDKLVKAIIKFLIWRLKTEATQSVKDYTLDENMQSLYKGKHFEVRCKLIKKGSDPVNMVVILSENGTIVEIKIFELPIIDGAKTVMKKYFESHGIKINTIKNPADRAEKCCEALEDFISTHSKRG